MSSSNPSNHITLKAGGPRTLVKEEEARQILERFQQELSSAQEGGAAVVVVDTVDLSCRSWPRSSLECIKPALEPTVATVTILKIDDIIASLPTEEGLESLEYFAELFGTSKVLKEIDLNDNALGSRGDVVLAPLFLLKSLERLSIENCGMSKEVAASLLNTLSASSSSLTHLSMGRNQIGAEGARHVGELLAKCPKLQVLNYNGCRPLKTGTAYLLQGLAQRTSQSLVHLNLHDCTIGSEEAVDDETGASALDNLVKIIANSPNLEVLNLQDGEIGTEGLERVLGALQESGARLTQFCLGGCELGEDGAQILADAICKGDDLLAKLQVLSIDTNELGDDGVGNLISALASSCPNLQSLDLETNEIGKDGSLAILQHKIPALRSLNLMDNMDIPAQVARKLQKLYPTVKVDEDLEEDEEMGNDDDDEEEEDDGKVDELTGKLAGTTLLDE